MATVSDEDMELICKKLKNLFLIQITNANSGKLSLTDSEITFEVICGFKPKYIKLYNSELGVILIYNENILYSTFVTDVTVTSEGFSFEKLHIGHSPDIIWEAYG